MKLSMVILGLALTANGLFAANTVAVGAPAPNFKIQLADGANGMLSDLKGKVVVLDFWASWCPWCVKEMPDVNSINKANQNVIVLGIDTEDSATIQQATAQLPVTFPTVSDVDSRIGDLYGVDGLPCSVVIDEQGNVAAVVEGYHSDGTLDQAVHQALAD